MIVDSSALVALFLREPGWPAVFDCLASAAVAGIGTPTLVETGIVLSARLERDAVPLLAQFLQEFDIDRIAFSETHWQEAVREPPHSVPPHSDRTTLTHRLFYLFTSEKPIFNP